MDRRQPRPPTSTSSSFSPSSSSSSRLFLVAVVIGLLTSANLWIAVVYDQGGTSGEYATFLSESWSNYGLLPSSSTTTMTTERLSLGRQKGLDMDAYLGSMVDELYFQSSSSSSSSTFPKTHLTLPFDNDNNNNPEECTCQLLSLDCLDTISCLYQNNDGSDSMEEKEQDEEEQKRRYAWILLGIEMRQTIKEELLKKNVSSTTSSDNNNDNNGPIPTDALQMGAFSGEVYSSGWRPLGKELQYAAISAWMRFTRALDDDDGGGMLPLKHDQRPSKFVDPRRYGDWCRIPQKQQQQQDDTQATTKPTALFREGLSCFFDTLIVDGRFVDQREVILEQPAVQWVQQRVAQQEGPRVKYHSSALRRNLQTRLKQVLGLRRTLGNPAWDKNTNNINNDKVSDGTSTGTVQNHDSLVSPLGHLLLFSHLLRMHFHRRPFLEELYQSKLATVSASDEETSTTRPFIVSLHLRRGDSCGDERGHFHKYETAPTVLDSVGQVTGKRKCYRAGVYLEALKRVRDMVPAHRPLDVHLSTDDNDQIMDEIAHDHADLLRNTSLVREWKFLNYSRTHFQYVSSAIEHQNDKDNMAVLGETAVSDLWHLSFGDAFVGHLGSRFGKVAWLLATARHGAMVPFMTVDGHSPCCEIDENCGQASQYINTMTDCLAFSYEFFRVRPPAGQYWEVGSLARQKLPNLTLLEDVLPGHYAFVERDAPV